MKNEYEVNGLLAALGAPLDLQFSLDEDLHCAFVFADGLECIVELADDGEKLFAYIPLVKAPDTDAERIEMLETALELNMFSLTTGSASVSFDRRTSYVTLTLCESVDSLEPDLFIGLMGDLMELAIDIKSALDQTPEKPDSPPNFEREMKFLKA